MHAFAFFTTIAFLSSALANKDLTLTCTGKSSANEIAKVEFTMTNATLLSFVDVTITDEHGQIIDEGRGGDLSANQNDHRGLNQYSFLSDGWNTITLFLPASGRGKGYLQRSPVIPLNCQ